MRTVAAPFQVQIVDVNLALLADAAAQRHHVDRDLGPAAARRRDQPQALDPRPPGARYDGRDLGQHIRRRTAQLGIPPALDDPGADQQRIQLVFGEHERRQVEALAEQVADAGRTLDWHTLGDQFGDVAVDRAHGNLELDRQGIGGDGPARAPEDLNDLAEPVGAPHRYHLPHHS